MKRALVTGANGDIGFSILLYLLNSGFEVWAIDKHINKLTNLKKNKKLTILQVDLLAQQEIEKIMNRVSNPFNVMIYAAGMREISALVELTLHEWQKIIGINLTGAFLISKFVTNLAIKNNIPLCIIYISSIAGIAGEPERSAYCSSKHGVIGLAKCLAIELAQYEIRVNVIAPGIIDTDLTRHYKNNPLIMNKIKNNVPLSKWGKTEHIVQVVELIIKNDYLTGSTIVVDGGWTAGKIL